LPIREENEMEKAKLLPSILVGLMFILLMCNDIVLAAEVSFRCTIKKTYNLADSGHLIERDNIGYTDLSFEIERSTGRIPSGAFMNSGEYAITVIDAGEEYSYRIVSTDGEIAQYLSVSIYQEGSKKAFVGINFLNAVVTGVCD